MRRLVFLLAVMALALVLASGGVLAVNRIGTNGPDTLKGTNGADSLLGKGGNDDLFGLGGRDNLLGGDGKDWVLGGNEQRLLGGDNNLVGGSGNDGVQSGRGSDSVLGGSGNDFVTGDNGSHNVVGEEGMDLVDGGRGSDHVVGGNDPDLLVGGPFDDTSKDDTPSGGDGDDAFFVDTGPATRDKVSCGSGFDRVAADTKDVVAPDCEQVRRGPTAGETHRIPRSVRVLRGPLRGFGIFPRSIAATSPVEASASGFGEFASEAQKAVDSVKWSDAYSDLGRY